MLFFEYCFPVLSIHDLNPSQLLDKVSVIGALSRPCMTQLARVMQEGLLFIQVADTLIFKYITVLEDFITFF